MDTQSCFFAGHLGHDGRIFGLSGYPPGRAFEGKEFTAQHTEMVVEYLFLVAGRHFYFSDGFLGLDKSRTDRLGHPPVGGVLRFSVGAANGRDAAFD